MQQGAEISEYTNKYPKMIEIEDIDKYLKAIKHILDKQLEIFSENILQKEQQTLDEIEIYKNIQALCYIHARYDLLKEALLLLSDSRMHIYWNVGKNAHVNTYAHITQQTMSADITESLEKLWQKISKELPSLTQKYQTEAFWLRLLYYAALFLYTSLTFATLISAIAINSHFLPLFISAMGIFFGGIILFLLTRSAINLIYNRPTCGMIEGPDLFKSRIASHFSSLEKKFIQNEVSTYSESRFNSCLTLSSIYKAPETELNVTSNESEVNLCITSKTIETKVDGAGKPTESKLIVEFNKQDPIAGTDLYKRFNNTNLLFLSSNKTSPKPLKDAVEEEYSQLQIQ